MMILSIAFYTMLASLVLGDPQSRPPRPPRPDSVNTSGGRRRPPPPPDSGSDLPEKLNSDGGIALGIPNAKPKEWIWDDNCRNDRPPFDLGRWIQVGYDECPIAFDDPDFHFHENFCE